MMISQAEPSGVTLTRADAALVKGMLARGDRQHDVAAYFGVNGGRIAEIATGVRFGAVSAAPYDDLPPPGPYPSGRDIAAAKQAVDAARCALDLAERIVRQYSH
jgi:hypothetical protein